MKSIVWAGRPRTRLSGFGQVACAAAAIVLLAAAPAHAGLFGGGKKKLPPAPVYTPPPVSLPARVVEAAAVYAAYVDTAAGITADFTDGPSVSSRLRAGAGYEAQQIQRGEAAYGAIAALQDPTFVAAVRAYAADATTRAQIAGELMKDPTYVLGIRGADSAAALAAYALDAQGVRIRTAGEKVKQSAYDVQKQPWSMAMVVDRDGRKAEAKALSQSPRTADPAIIARLQAASSGQAPMPLIGGTSLTGPRSDLAAPLFQPSVSPTSLTPASTADVAAPPPVLARPYTPLVVRSLAAAALAVLGEGSETNSDYIWAILAEPNQGMCFNMAKLNLYQCLSVAKPYYEDVFCLGQHILIDTGQCIVRGAGVQAVTPVVFEDRPNAVAYGAKATPKKSGKKTPAKKKK